MSYILSIRQIDSFQAPVPSMNNAWGSPNIFFINTIYVGFKTSYVSMGFMVVNRPRLIFERFCVFLLYSLLAFYMKQRREINNFELAFAPCLLQQTLADMYFFKAPNICIKKTITILLPK
jgi:hypothetical protein